MRITLLTAAPVGLSLVLTSLAPPANATPRPAPPASVAAPHAPEPHAPEPHAPAPHVPTPGTEDRGPRNVHARSAFLLDDTSGRTLWARSSRTRRPIGSITKVMTALVILREGGLDRRVRVDSDDLDYATERNGSIAHLRPGERFTVRELLAAMLIPSGCDAASALANAYGPGHAGFIRKMNQTARSLGLDSTYFNDPAGLPPDPGWSTARDLVTLGRAAMRYKEFRDIVGKDEYVAKATGAHRRYHWYSTDSLLGEYHGLIGIKSGYTSDAGFSFLFAARRHGRTIYGAVLDSSRTRRNARFQDATSMLNWAFR